MTHEQRKTRQKKASLLEVKQVDPITFLVQSQSDPEMFHKVTLNGHSSCSCLDWRRNHKADPAWACKHIAAALDLKAQVERMEASKAPSKPAIGFAAPAPSRIELECQAMFGNQEAIATLNGRPARPATYEPAPAVEVPRTVQPAAAALLDEPALEDGPEAGWIDCCPGCGRSLPECACTKEEPKTKAAPAVPTLANIHAALTRPFPIAQVEVKPGAVAGGKALALAYVDMRAYQARLDETAGPEGWSVEYRPLGDRAVICRLTVLGVTREDVGEADTAEANWATCMTAQAFKRACASFGLGRYLYSLPKVWAEYDQNKKVFRRPAEIVRDLYDAIKA